MNPCQNLTNGSGLLWADSLRADFAGLIRSGLTRSGLNGRGDRVSAVVPPVERDLNGPDGGRGDMPEPGGPGTGLGRSRTGLGRLVTGLRGGLTGLGKDLTDIGGARVGGIAPGVHVVHGKCS